MESFRIRRATDKDLARIDFIENESYKTSPYPKELLEKLLSDNNESFLVAEDKSNGIIGYSVSTSDGQTAHLISIAVLPGHRNKGAGTRLMTALIRYLRRERIESLWLEVDRRNEDAIRLYKKLGFMKIMLLENYYSDGSDAIRMRMRLKQNASRSSDAE